MVFDLSYEDEYPLDGIRGIGSSDSYVFIAEHNTGDLVVLDYDYNEVERHSLTSSWSGSNERVVDVSPDNQYVAVCGWGNNTLHIAEINNGLENFETITSLNRPYVTAWSPDSSELLVTTLDRGFYILSAGSWSVLEDATSITGNICRAADYSPDGNTIAVSIGSGNAIIVDRSSMSVDETLSIDSGTGSHNRFSLDGNYLFYGSWDDNFVALDTSDYSEVYRDSLSGSIYSIDVVPGYVMYGEGSGGNTLYVRDTSDWSLETYYTCNSNIDAVHVFDNNSKLAVGNWSSVGLETFTIALQYEGVLGCASTSNYSNDLVVNTYASGNFTNTTSYSNTTYKRGFSEFTFESENRFSPVPFGVAVGIGSLTGSGNGGFIETAEKTTGFDPLGSGVGEWSTKQFAAPVFNPQNTGVISPLLSRKTDGTLSYVSDSEVVSDYILRTYRDIGFVSESDISPTLSVAYRDYLSADNTSEMFNEADVDKFTGLDATSVSNSTLVASRDYHPSVDDDGTGIISAEFLVFLNRLTHKDTLTANFAVQKEIDGKFDYTEELNSIIDRK